MSFEKLPLHEKIERANAEALHRITSGEVSLVAIAPAGEVMPFLRDHPKSLVHAGPPIAWRDMANAMKGAIVGMVLLEGWASDEAEARALLDSGKVTLGSANENDAVGPMSGIITPSLPVFVVENKTFGNRSFSRPADLHQQFGNFAKLEAVREWRDVVAPGLAQGLRQLGEVPLIPLLNRALEMGDELHNRPNALTELVANHLQMGMLNAGVSSTTMLACADFIHVNPNGVRLTLGLAMAAAHALMKPAMGIDYSTIVTTMARNGVEWGIRVSATGPVWFKAPAPTCFKYLAFPPYTPADFGNDIGDSVITETVGWGGFVLSNSMALAYNVGCSPEEAVEITKRNLTLMSGTHPHIKVPAFGYNGAPVGLDIRRVISSSYSPVINTGITHKEAGHSVVARGLVKTPLQCFQGAFDAFCEKHNVSRGDVLATLRPQQAAPVPAGAGSAAATPAVRPALPAAILRPDWVHDGFIHPRLAVADIDLEQLDWKPFAVAGIDCVFLYRDDGGPSSALLRFSPGTRVPSHWHRGWEHVFCLKGGFSDERGEYSKGELMFNPPGSQHRTVYSKDGCIVLMIWERGVCFHVER